MRFLLHPHPMRRRLSSFLALFLSICIFGQQPAPGAARVEVPGVKGVLEIDVGPSPWHLDFLPEDKWTMLQARQRPDHVSISALLRQVTFAATAESCRNELWPKLNESLGNRISNPQQNIRGGFARVEYTFNETENTVSHHLIAYLGSRDLCSEIHLSKVGFVPADQNAFEQVLSSVRLLPDQSGLQAAGQPESSSSLVAQGDEARTQSNYAPAARFYQRAFDLEKANQTFDNDTFLELISKLAFSYRMNGDLSKAKDTLDYGLSQNATYPIFHYDMACTYAQMGKVDESLGQLRLAFQYRSKVAPVQVPANPEEDSCFSKIANDPRFTVEVQKLEQQQQ
jgi:tetratricopeptide (TPR) repeat protein